jgi:hypothetical protein
MQLYSAVISLFLFSLLLLLLLRSGRPESEFRRAVGVRHTLIRRAAGQFRRRPPQLGGRPAYAAARPVWPSSSSPGRPRLLDDLSALNACQSSLNHRLISLQQVSARRAAFVNGRGGRPAVDRAGCTFRRRRRAIPFQAPATGWLGTNSEFFCRAAGRQYRSDSRAAMRLASGRRGCPTGARQRPSSEPFRGRLERKAAAPPFLVLACVNSRRRRAAGRFSQSTMANGAKQAPKTPPHWRALCLAGQTRLCSAPPSQQVRPEGAKRRRTHNAPLN